MPEPRERLEKNLNHKDGEARQVEIASGRERKPVKDQVRGKRSLRSEVMNFSLIIISILAGLSIVSYSPADDANSEIGFFDMFRLFLGDEALRAKADAIHNWLGIFGAYIANFFVNSTLGYFAIAFPVILLIFSWTALQKRDYVKAARISTMVLIYGIVIAVLSGYLKALYGTDKFGKEWYGLIGEFSALALIRALGAVGGAAVIFLVLFSLVVFTLKISPQELVNAFIWLFSLIFKSIGSLFAFIFSRRKPKGEVVISRDDEKRVFPVEPVKIVREDARTKHDANLIEEAKELVKRSFTRAEEAEEEISDEEPEEGREKLLITRKVIPPPRFTDSETAESVNQDEEIEYTPPPLDLLDVPVQVDKISDDELRANAELLRSKLQVFDIEIENVSVIPGPVVTLYELVPASGVKISRITSLEDDLALALQARGIRIIAPIPGKGAVGVEIPNHKPQIVNFRSVVSSAKFQDLRFNLPIAMGKTITGEIFVDDLSRMPHLLIAGATGSGKSVGINTIMMSMIYKLKPWEIKFVIIDPKKIELSLYKKLSKHFLAVSPDVDEEIITDAGNAVLALKSVESEMDDRYSLLAKAGVRNIQDYNKKLAEGKLKENEETKFVRLPYIVIFIDELADLMLTAAHEVEDPITRLAQLARAVGIHLVLATQRPSVDVITGLIKANFPARIAYQVASRIDSRTILDQNGAEQLLGNGDMLYLAAGSSKPERMQNSFLSTEEIEKVVDFISAQKGYSRPYQLPSVLVKKGNGGAAVGEYDEMFEEAARLVVRHQQASTSFLQRRLKLGYGRAARVIDELENAGIVGPFEGSKGREVLLESEAELDTRLTELGM
ncbi:MAG TPA: DNA translocase FtsK 4TM domain-containing protein [Candidatus Acidoferrales bacterium]|nr:DNA translocase FtsK 4TM domain-containing protein [Candidatus Acidoferrales bacterium]